MNWRYIPRKDGSEIVDDETAQVITDWDGPLCIEPTDKHGKLMAMAPRMLEVIILMAKFDPGPVSIIGRCGTASRRSRAIVEELGRKGDTP